MAAAPGAPISVRKATLTEQTDDELARTRLAPARTRSGLPLQAADGGFGFSGR
jgi:hypothetical protein